MKKLLELKSIYAAYEEEEILKDINLTVYENDFIGIIGPNGGGKTTLIKVILGLLKPKKGEIIFHQPRNIGYLPQFNLKNDKFPITIFEVISSGLSTKKKFFKKISKEEEKKVLELMKIMKILDLKDKVIGELSGGQKQKAFLCRAIISDPKILILDEPNTFVDKKFQKEMYELLKELNKKMAILLITHDIGVIPSIIKTIACVNVNLNYHDSNKIGEEELKAYNCPVELITHGKVPHRVLAEHKGEKND
ncbi:MAG: zinc ABC transporter ATP-binding protein [Fusobacteriia bacterium 4572_132]|nr:MAG: zinc ABC transporter ATP-binding protein [Fusobacteriia bacterium 4572_132]